MDRDNVAGVPLARPKTAEAPAPGAEQGPEANAKPEADARPPSIARATRSELRELRAGKVRPQETVDLHGFRREDAHRRLCNAVARAIEKGQRCVRVIHGKGHRSAGGQAVLRDALADWLGQRPLVEQVTGSAPARPRDGGSGATLLLLRRPSGQPPGERPHS